MLLERASQLVEAEIGTGRHGGDDADRLGKAPCSTISKARQESESFKTRPLVKSDPNPG